MISVAVCRFHVFILASGHENKQMNKPKQCEIAFRVSITVQQGPESIRKEARIRTQHLGVYSNGNSIYVRYLMLSY